jgi:hypothetical protein
MSRRLEQQKSVRQQERFRLLMELLLVLTVLACIGAVIVLAWQLDVMPMQWGGQVR